MEAEPYLNPQNEVASWTCCTPSSFLTWWGKNSWTRSASTEEVKVTKEDLDHFCQHSILESRQDRAKKETLPPLLKCPLLQWTSTSKPFQFQEGRAVDNSLFFPHFLDGRILWVYRERIGRSWCIPFIPTFIGKIFQFPPINGMVEYAADGREVNSSGGERSLSDPETRDTGGLIRVDPVARKCSFLVGKRGR